MEAVVVGIIVAGAVGLMVRGMVRTFRGDRSCSCCSKSSCPSGRLCALDDRKMEK